MKVFKLFVLQFLFATKAFGADIVIQSDGSNEAQFRQYLFSNPDTEAFSNNYYLGMLDLCKKFEVRDHFIKAKTALITGKTTEAKSELFELIAKGTSCDWSDDDRILLVHSNLLLAELSPSEKEKRYWITKALALGLGFIPAVSTLSTTTQALIKNYPKPNKISFSPKIFSDWDKILVNGLEVNLQNVSSLYFYDDNYRITFLSSRFLPVTRILHRHQIEKIEVNPQWLATGTCENPSLDFLELKGKQVKVLFSESCTRTWNNGWSSQEAKSFLTPYRLGENLTSERPLEKPSDTPVYKKPVFWGTALALGAAIILLNQDKDSSPPSNLPPISDGSSSFR